MYPNKQHIIILEFMIMRNDRSKNISAVMRDVHACTIRQEYVIIITAAATSTTTTTTRTTTTATTTATTTTTTIIAELLFHRTLVKCTYLNDNYMVILRDYMLENISALLMPR